MDLQQDNADPRSLSAIWRSAERQRAEDIGSWLSNFFEQRRRLRACDTGTSFPQGNPVLR